MTFSIFWYFWDPGRRRFWMFSKCVCVFSNDFEVTSKSISWFEDWRFEDLRGTFHRIFKSLGQQSHAFEVTSKSSLVFWRWKIWRFTRHLSQNLQITGPATYYTRYPNDLKILGETSQKSSNLQSSNHEIDFEVTSKSCIVCHIVKWLGIFHRISKAWDQQHHPWGIYHIPKIWRFCERLLRNQRKSMVFQWNLYLFNSFACLSQGFSS